MLKTKSVHSRIEPGDGLRILTSRLRGRGLPRTEYDIWMPNLGPSEALPKRRKAEAIVWKDYGRSYTAELFLNGKLDARIRTIKNHGQKFTLRLIKEQFRRCETRNCQQRTGSSRGGGTAVAVSALGAVLCHAFRVKIISMAANLNPWQKKWP